MMHIRYISQICRIGLVEAITLKFETGKEIIHEIKDKFYFPDYLNSIILIGDLLPVFDNSEERLYRFLEQANQKKIPIVGIFRHNEGLPKGEHGLSKIIKPSDDLKVEKIVEELGNFFYEHDKMKIA